METTFAVLSGVFFGTTVVLFLDRFGLISQHRRTDAERMKVYNKLFVREGHTSLFTDREIEGTPPAPVVERGEPASNVRKLTSPFRRAQSRMRENLEEAKRQEAGNRLPPDMKASIAAAAEAARNGANN